ncbi:zinc-dependent alcohol dehydrogenase [Ancylobacter sp.]|uniref:zinc-dependent alcohol dehydrogenase n=1 Tax=Ancylobacter sp. TaxID=1872567 RepID=UPI003BA96615
MSYDFNDMRLEDIPEPKAEPGWVVCRTRVLELSVTEVAEFQGVPISSHEALKAMFAQKKPLPLFGHEFCAEVVEVGAGVTNVKLGDRVFYHRGVPCGSCKYCQAGMQQYCRSVLNVGEDTPGCLAEYFPVPARMIAAVPKEVSDFEAAALQPLVSIVGAVNGVGIEMGDTVAVIGLGPMGLDSLQVARCAGAGRVIAIARRDPVLQLAKSLGADVLVNITEQDPVEAVMEASGGLGCDVVFDCAGGATGQGHAGTDAFHQGLQMLRPEGRIIEIGHFPGGTQVTFAPIEKKGLRIIGRRPPTPKMIRYAIDLVASKRVQIEPTIKHTLHGLDQVPKAFEMLANKSVYGVINPPQVVVWQ